MRGGGQSAQLNCDFRNSPTKVMLILVLTIFLAAALISCSNEETRNQSVSKDGEKLFKQSVIRGKAGCATCHSLEEGVILIGPSLAGIGTTSAQRIPGMSAEEYVRESILKPNAYVLEGFSAGVMPDSYVDILSEEEINLIVDYLLTLK